MKATRMAAVLLMIAATAWAQTTEPVTVNGTVAKRSVSVTLEGEFAAIGRDNAGPYWVGYAVRGRERSGGDGCWDGRNSVRVTPIKLEGSADLFILFRVQDNAVVGIALHGDGAAADRLIAIAKDGRDRQSRSQALFWLSQRAGDRAAGTITDAIERDPDTQVKRQAVFALSQLPRGEGVTRLIDVAKALAFFEEVLR